MNGLCLAAERAIAAANGPIRVLLLAFGLVVVVCQPAHGRPCGRWTATMTSDTGSVTTLRLFVRECGILPAHVPPQCEGRYRCTGPACPSRRGRFSAYMGSPPPGISPLLIGEFRPRRASSTKPSCFTRPPMQTESSARYTCYLEGDAIADQGTFACQTKRACGAFSC
jgi:hypothetical protein